MVCKLKIPRSIDKCVVLAAMNVRRLTALFKAGHLFAIVLKVIGRLREAIVQPGLSRWCQCLDLYIWVSFIGLVNEFQTPERRRFADLLAALLKIKYKSGWPANWQAEVLEMLRSFLWSEARLTNLYGDACHLVNARLDQQSLASEAD